MIKWIGWRSINLALVTGLAAFTTAGCGSADTTSVVAESQASVPESSPSRYTANQASQWVATLADVPVRLDFGRDPSDFSSFVDAGARVFSGRTTTTAQIQAHEVALPQAEGEARVARSFDFLALELALDGEGRIPLEFYLGPTMAPGGNRSKALESLSLAPPAGTRVLVAVMNDFDRLRPELGYWTVVETSDGGFVVGGPTVKDQRSIEGISRFSELVTHLAG
jgi:hypothetical protein